MEPVRVIQPTNAEARCDNDHLKFQSRRERKVGVFDVFPCLRQRDESRGCTTKPVEQRNEFRHSGHFDLDGHDDTDHGADHQTGNDEFPVHASGCELHVDDGGQNGHEHAHGAVLVSTGAVRGWPNFLRPKMNNAAESK